MVVNYGLLPLDELYFELRPLSTDGRELDHDAFINGDTQTTVRNENGSFYLFRIGDAISSRNTYAAIYDALRLMQNI